MYLKRKVDSFLAAWKSDSGRKPLIIKGSRQIGKTESVLHDILFRNGDLSI